ncbi:hypothetical protein KFU94_25735 [Chloroflexi bacterium TSY]|nr:hypothetical protein [Chloroflexi bacterium TSY]
MVVPIKAHKRLYGLFYLYYIDIFDSDEFAPEDIDIAMMFGRLVGRSIEQSRYLGSVEHVV